MLVALGLLAAALLFLALDRAALGMVRPPRRTSDRTPDRELEHESVSFASDGRTLRGWLYRPEAPRTAIVLIHGWGGHAGDLLPLADHLAARGHPTLVFDVRRHGRSDDAPHVTARQFRDDVLAATAFLRARVSGPVALVGHSLGGAAAVLAAADGAQVDGVAHVAAPADVIDVIRHFFDRRGLLPGRLMVAVLGPFWRLRAGVPTWDVLQPHLRARDLRQPLLVVAGGKDDHVPVEHVARMRGAPHGEELVLPDKGHFDILAADAFRTCLASFLDGLQNP